MAKRARPLNPGDLPAIVPVFPLNGALLLPRTHRPLNVFEPRFLDLVDYALATDRLIALAQPLESDEEAPKGRVPLCPVGGLGRLTHFEQAEDNRYIIVLEGLTRVELREEAGTKFSFRRFAVSAKRFASDFDPEFGATDIDRLHLEKTLRAYADFASLDLDWEQIAETGTTELVDLCCMLGPFGTAEKQMLLEARTPSVRAETLIALAELEMARGGPGQTVQ